MVTECQSSNLVVDIFTKTHETSRLKAAGKRWIKRSEKDHSKRHGCPSEKQGLLEKGPHFEWTDA